MEKHEMNGKTPQLPLCLSCSSSDILQIRTSVDGLQIVLFHTHTYTHTHADAHIQTQSTLEPKVKESQTWRVGGVSFTTLQGTLLGQRV